MIKYSAGNVVVIHDKNPPGEGRLHIMGSLFWGSVQETPGTEFADERESTSYSGA